MAPEAHAKRTGDSFRRISALLRARPAAILLFERQTRGERAQPVAGGGQRSPTVGDRGAESHARCELERAPSHGALASPDGPAESLCSTLARELIRVLRGRETLRPNDGHRRTRHG